MSAATEQSREEQEVIRFLKSPSSYSHEVTGVHFIETHISWVFIASPFVFKVKRPVNLGFADFSTLKKRRYFCERELELNRRLCPEVYLKVVPICARNGGFSFEQKGTVVEYALKMKELPKGWFLRELLAKGLVGETEIKRVIERLRQFYAAQTPRPEIEEWGTPQKLKISTDENFAQVEPFMGTTITPVAFEAIRHFTNEFYAQNEQLFHERIAQHRILDCHGDLHLDHIHITPDAVTIFDCIEFNDRFRFIDIASDLAFLAMDFDFERQHKLGALFLRRAAQALRDPGILELADFYKCYRAFVRGKVESLQRNSEEHAQSARRYFQLALRYATVGSEPLVLVVMGRVASGKTTVARQLGGELDWPVFSSDAIRKTFAGIPLTSRTAPELRGKVYSETMSGQTYASLLENALAALETHGGVILDATFSSRARRDTLRAECATAGVRLRLIELRAEREEVEKRLRTRDEHATEISDARLEDLKKLNATYEPPEEFASELISIRTTGSPAETTRDVLVHLAEKRAN